MTTDFARYARQVSLREVGVHGQQLLRDSSALVIGLGGLGSVASMYLVGAGVGRVLLSDRDRVELGNLHRQVLYTQDDVGRSKTEAAAQRLAALNPDVNLLPREGRLGAETLAQMVGEVDVVLDCTDNFPTRFAINQACVNARKPLVSGAAIRFDGQLAVFDARRADSACYACVFPPEGESAETCEEAGVLGPVVGVIGSLQAHLALGLLVGHLHEFNRLRIWNALDLRWRDVELKKDPQCRVCGNSRMKPAPDSNMLRIPRRLAIQLLAHAQQLPPEQPLKGVLTGTLDSLRFYPGDPPADAAVWAGIQSGASAPAAMPAGVSRVLGVALDTKGVLQLRCWEPDRAGVRERELQIGN